MAEGVGRIATHSEPQIAQPPFWAAAVALAVGQHGVVSLEQLVGMGMSASGVSTWVARRRLHRIHRGVYAVGQPGVSWRGRLMAAVLACGEGAAVSHRSAAALWGIRPSARPAVDVSVPGRNGRSRPGIDIHRCALPAGDVTTVDRIPCTTVARTLLDLAALGDLAGVERAIAQAEVLRVYDHREVEATLARANGRRGTGRLRAALRLQSEPGITRSELEERFLAICDRAGIRRPEMNAWIALPDGDVEIDFLWRHERLAVETDGRAVHATLHAFEADRERDQRLVLAGWRPVRFTRRQVVLHADDVRRRLLALLD